MRLFVPALRISRDTVRFVMPDMIRHPWIAGRARNDRGKAISLGISWLQAGLHSSGAR